jgi:hypothetical protein
VKQNTPVDIKHESEIDITFDEQPAILPQLTLNLDDDTRPMLEHDNMGGLDIEISMDEQSEESGAEEAHDQL